MREAPGRNDALSVMIPRKAPRLARHWIPLLAVIGVLALGACTNPVALPDPTHLLDHTTSSGNHTTSSGNASGSDR